jgi:DNA-binding NtrC family response regulator
VPDGHRILIADDEETFLLSTARLLERQGYHLDRASDAPSARALLHASQYDVVISDVRMPGNAGLAFLREVIEITPGTPLIVVTGYPSAHREIEAAHLAFAACLVKPIAFAELLMHVEDAIRKS